VYTSTELDSTFTVTTQNGRLLLKRDEDAEPQPLQPGADGQYRLRTLIIRFVRDSEGKIEALLVDAGRVRDVRFQRQR
jgi:hypothetical protein